MEDFGDFAVTLPAAMDLGNYSAKVLTMSSRNPRSDFELSAVMPLTHYEYSDLIDDPSINHDQYALVNGEPYCIGQAAVEKRRGQAVEGTNRWRPDYIGVLAAVMLRRLFDTNGKVILMVTYPPGHHRQRERLFNALRGRWHVEMYGEGRTYDVVAIRSCTEASGGLWNLTLDWQGRVTDEGILHADPLIIDIGGGTTDVQGFGPSGELLPEYRASFAMGINHVLRDFQTELHASGFPDTLRDKHLRDALRTGKWGPTNEDVSREARRVLDPYIAEVERTAQEASRGLINWSPIILTGGGAAVIRDHLAPRLGNGKRVKLAALPGEEDDIHLANVRGAAKLFRWWKLNGVI